MKKILLFLLASFSICSLGFGQDMSFNELVKLRADTYPAFETFVHDRGYKLDHLEYNEKCAIFRNGKNMISYCHYYDDELAYHNHIAIKFETSDKDVYEKIKQQAEVSLQYYKTKMQIFRKMHYLEHIYVNDAISAHFYDITYKNDDKPYYEVEVYSIYAGY